MATTTQKPYLWAKVQKKDGNGKITYVNSLTQPDPQNPEQTLMDSLLKTIDAYAVEK
jgi:hypothetical protein